MVVERRDALAEKLVWEIWGSIGKDRRREEQWVEWLKERRFESQCRFKKEELSQPLCNFGGNKGWTQNAWSCLNHLQFNYVGMRKQHAKKSWIGYSGINATHRILRHWFHEESKAQLGKVRWELPLNHRGILRQKAEIGFGRGSWALELRDIPPRHKCSNWIWRRMEEGLIAFRGSVQGHVEFLGGRSMN